MRAKPVIMFNNKEYKIFESKEQFKDYTGYNGYPLYKEFKIIDNKYIVEYVERMNPRDIAYIKTTCKAIKG